MVNRKRKSVEAATYFDSRSFTLFRMTSSVILSRRRRIFLYTIGEQTVADYRVEKNLLDEPKVFVYFWQLINTLTVVTNDSDRE